MLSPLAISVPRSLICLQAPKPVGFQPFRSATELPVPIGDL
jgi:hypothetical protein